MRSLKRMLLLGLLSILAMLAFAIPAQATSSLKGECTITGEAKTFNKAGVKTPVPVSLGTGKYTFTSLLIRCVGLTKGDPTIVNITAESSGWYDNIVCGTGKAYGDPGGINIRRVSGGTKPLSFYEALLEDEKYKIIFTATVGEFYWHDWEKPDTTIDPKDELGDIGQYGIPPAVPPTAPGDSKVYEDSKGWDLAGEVTLTTPTEKPVPPPPCTDAFTVAGVIGIDES